MSVKTSLCPHLTQFHNLKFKAYFNGPHTQTSFPKHSTGSLEWITRWPVRQGGGVQNRCTGTVGGRGEE